MRNPLCAIVKGFANQIKMMKKIYKRKKVHETIFGRQPSASFQIFRLNCIAAVHQQFVKCQSIHWNHRSSAR